MLSLQISVLTVYLVLLLAVTAASVVLSVLILCFHHRPDSFPVTGCLATTTLALRKLLRMRKIQPGKEEEERSGEGINGKEKDARSSTDVTLVDSFVSGQGFGNRPTRNSVSPATSGSDEGPGSNSGTFLTRRDKMKSVSGRTVAETLDKFIFLLFTFISLGSTVVCLIVLIVGAYQQERDTSLT